MFWTRPTGAEPEYAGEIIHLFGSREASGSREEVENHVGQKQNLLPPLDDSYELDGGK